MATPSPLKRLGALDGGRDVRVPVGAGLVLCVEGADAALGDHGLDVLGVERLLEQVHDIELDRVEHNVTGKEQLVWLAEAELLEGAHQLLVGLPALAHCESVAVAVVVLCISGCPIGVVVVAERDGQPSRLWEKVEK